MLSPRLLLAASALLLFPMSCLAGPVGAKEHSVMSATPKSTPAVFTDPQIAPLAEAVAHGDVAAIRRLAGQADLSARGDQHVTLLEWAVWNQQPESLAALLDAGADPAQLGMDDETVVHMAAMVKDERYLRLLLDHHAPVDIVSPRAGWTPLFRAVESKRQAQVDLLIAAGANLRQVDAMGNSLLHQSAKSGASSALVLTLLERGVDPTLKNAQHASFQSYFFATPEPLLNAQGREARQQVQAWLSAHHIPLEASR
ncbi:ankyrin repeat domain-containing protein [Xanthomonas sp. Kuri4-1]